MSSAVDLGRVPILVPGRMLEHGARRIETTFDMVRLDRSDASLITPQLAERVRGIGVHGGVNAALIDALPNLEIIANFGVGYDGVDAAHAGKRGIMVTNTPDVLTEEVADTALGLLINTVRELSRAEQYLRQGRWAKDGDYPFTRATLRGRKAGILGMGRIGMAIARRLEAFGLEVSYHNRRKVDGLPYAYHASLLDMAKAVDTLISVVPGGAATAKVIDADVLKALGPSGVFINIGRGSSVDEPALIRALRDGTIYAAGLDVFADEPRVPQDLIDLPNAVLLPHVGSASVHTRNGMADLLVDNLVSWFTDGKAITPVPETIHATPRAR